MNKQVLYVFVMIIEEATTNYMQYWSYVINKKKPQNLQRHWETSFLIFYSLTQFALSGKNGILPMNWNFL